jgi:hypothetical protein
MWAQISGSDPKLRQQGPRGADLQGALPLVVRSVARVVRTRPPVRRPAAVRVRGNWPPVTRLGATLGGLQGRAALERGTHFSTVLAPHRLGSLLLCPAATSCPILQDCACSSGHPS